MMAGLGLGSGLGAGMGGAAGPAGALLRGIGGFGMGGTNAMGNQPTRPGQSQASVPQGGETENSIWSQLSDEFFGNPGGMILSGLGQMRGGYMAPEYGVMTFNQSRALPNVGPGITGLQGLSYRGY